MRASQGRHEEHGRAHTGQGLRDLLPWTPTLIGVLALIMLLIVAATRFASSPAPAALPPAATFLPPPVLAPIPLPPGPDLVPLSPALPAASVSTSASALPGKQVIPATAPTSPRPSRSSSRPTATPKPSPGPVSGHYRVMDSYADSFIGEVLVANSSGSDRDWRVELRFPAAVGDLVTSWVEGAPQATLRRSGDSYIWSSGVPVPARSQVPLRFHFSRSGSGNLPSACTVNGGTCTGL